MISLSGNILVLSSLLFLFGYVKGMYIKSINFYDDDEMIFESEQVILAFYYSGNISGHCFTQDGDFIGNPVRGIKDFHICEIESPEDCQVQCQNDADCEFWVWNGPSSNANKNTCWLKSSNEQSSMSVGKVSGAKTGCEGKVSCIEMNIDYYDMLYQPNI